VQGAFESYAPASAELTLLRRGGSIVTLGNMITIPVGGGLLYIEPVYVSAAAAGSTGSYPSLQRVFVYYAGQPALASSGQSAPVGFAPTLSGALAQLFTKAPSQQNVSSPGGAGRTGSSAVSGRVQADLAQAQLYYQHAQADLKASNLAAYAKAIAKMEQEISAAQQAAKASGTPSSRDAHAPAPSPSPSASR
jgi:uncharacterized protein